MASFWKAPFFPLLAFYVAGLLSPPHLILNLLLVAFFLAASAYLLKKKTISIWLCLALPSFFLFGQIIQVRPKVPADLSHIYYHLQQPRKVELVGLIVSSPEKFAKKTRIHLESESFLSLTGWTKAGGRMRVDLYGEVPELKYGDRIRIAKVKLRRPTNFRNPGGFDYVRFLRHREIWVSGWTGRKDRVVVERGPSPPFFQLVHLTRSRMAAFARENMSHRNASIFQALLFGQRSGLSRHDADLFIETGIAHLTAVSGLHIGLVAGFSYFVLEWMGIRFLIRFFPLAAMGGWSGSLAAFGTFFPVLFYALLVGEKVSSIRAVIMAVLFLLSIMLRRGQFHYYTLATAALVILIWKPGSLWEAGFQLSFCAVFFILFLLSRWTTLPDTAYSPLTSTRWEEFLVKHKRLTGYVFVTLFATMATFPLIAYHFNRFTPYAILLNLMAVPLVTVVVILGLFLSFLSLFFQELAGFLAAIPELLISLLVEISEAFSKIPYGSIRVSTPSPGFMAAFYFMLIGISIFKKDWKKLLPVVIVSVSMIVLFPGQNSRYPDGKLSAAFLDVGQGDSTFLRFPKGQTMLVDGGRAHGNMDMGKWVVGPFLWDMGVRRVDYLVVSHPDNDHMGGLLYILREFEVGAVLENGEVAENPILKAIRKTAKERGIPVRVLKRGDLLEVDGVRVEVLNPAIDSAPTPKESHKGKNNRSLALRVGCGKMFLLLPGDMEAEAEADLVGSGMELRSTILKAPHHGSRTSSTAPFIKAVAPEVVVVSADANNRFGHPSPQVRKRYVEAGAKVYTTGRSGAVEVFSDCDEYRVESMKGIDN